MRAQAGVHTRIMIQNVNKKTAMPGKRGKRDGKRVRNVPGGEGASFILTHPFFSIRIF